MKTTWIVAAGLCFGLLFAPGHGLAVPVRDCVPMSDPMVWAFCTPGSPIPAKDVSTGATHTCVRLEFGGVDCWGRNQWGMETDYWDLNHDQVPAHEAGKMAGIHLNAPVAALEAGGYHTCVVLENRSLQCWGENRYGQLHVDTQGRPVEKVSAAHYTTCALVEGGDVYCAGQEPTARRTPYLGGDAIDISVHGTHACVLRTDGNTTCWGWDYAITPYLGGDAVKLGHGEAHTEMCVVVRSGNVRCIGGDSLKDYEGGDAVDVAHSGKFACVLRTDATVFCYGTLAARMNQPDLDDVVAIDAGRGHACALRASGQVVCWGRDTWYQQPYGYTHDYPVEVVVPPAP